MKKLIKLNLLMLASLINFNAFAREENVIARGRLLTLSSTTIKVGTLSCSVNNSTEYRDINDRAISASAFTIGENVKLKCRDGVAHELEKEGSSSTPTPSATSTPVGTRTPSVTPTSNDNRNDDDDNRRGDDKRSDNSQREIVFERRLKRVADVATRSKGKLEYKLKVNKRETRGLLKLSVKVPVPSTIPAVADQDAAGSLALKAKFSRADTKDNTNFAQCNFAFDRLVENEDGGIFAEYKVTIETRKGSLSSKKGSCDIDLTAEGEQSGLPRLKKGDSVVVEDATALGFLAGRI